MPFPAFSTPRVIFTLAIALRLFLLLFGLFQDAYAPLPYTDIDYFVFTDAARYVSKGSSPYGRETYRYTPLLAWLLLPTTFVGPGWFSFGKVLFAAADIVAGWIMVLVLRSPMGGRLEPERALQFASIWLLNPMVATISTRGSSEGLLGVMVVALLWAVLSQKIALAGFLLGLAVHFKIYPFIYGISILWYLDSPSAETHVARTDFDLPNVKRGLVNFVNRPGLTLLFSSLATFLSLNIAMYALYGQAFLQHTYLHHVTRIDHRHNFSPYNTLLHLNSANPSPRLRIESLAFVPQLALSALLIPLTLAKRDLPGTMLAQTFAFVAFNKVCTSQYFLWYLVLLPFYLPYSSLVQRPWLGAAVGVGWVGAQGLWLWEGWKLEYLGQSRFTPGLWLAGLGFMAVNCWILGIMIGDIGQCGGRRGEIDKSRQQEQKSPRRSECVPRYEMQAARVFS